MKITIPKQKKKAIAYYEDNRKQTISNLFLLSRHLGEIDVDAGIALQKKIEELTPSIHKTIEILIERNTE